MRQKSIPPGGRAGTEAAKRLERVVRLAAGVWRVDKRNLEARFSRDRKGGHGETIGERSRRALRLERLRAYRSKQDGIQLQRIEGGARHSQVAEVGRIEAPAKERNAPAV